LFFPCSKLKNMNSDKVEKCWRCGKPIPEGSGLRYFCSIDCMNEYKKDQDRINAYNEKRYGRIKSKKNTLKVTTEKIEGVCENSQKNHVVRITKAYYTYELKKLLC